MHAWCYGLFIEGCRLLDSPICFHSKVIGYNCMPGMLYTARQNAAAMGWSIQAALGLAAWSPEIAYCLLIPTPWLFSFCSIASPMLTSGNAQARTLELVCMQALQLVVSSCFNLSISRIVLAGRALVVSLCACSQCTHHHLQGIFGVVGSVGFFNCRASSQMWGPQ